MLPWVSLSTAFGSCPIPLVSVICTTENFRLSCRLLFWSVYFTAAYIRPTAVVLITAAPKYPTGISYTHLISMYMLCIGHLHIPYPNIAIQHLYCADRMYAEGGLQIVEKSRHSNSQGLVPIPGASVMNAGPGTIWSILYPEH